MSGPREAIHYQAKTEPIQPVVPLPVTSFLVSSSLARHRIVTEIRRPSGAAMVFPHLPIVQIFQQPRQNIIDPPPHREAIGFQNIFPETPKLVWLQQDDNKNRVSSKVKRQVQPFFNIAPETPKLVWQQVPGNKNRVDPPVFRQEDVFFNIFPETPKLPWMTVPARSHVLPTYIRRQEAPFPFDIVVAPPAAVQIAWLVNQSRYVEAVGVLRHDQPHVDKLFVTAPPTASQLEWLHDFARIVEQDIRDPNSVSGRAAPVWTEDDDVRYRHLIKYIQ